MDAPFHLTQPELDAIAEKFTGRKVLIVGDVMCDAYWWGRADRISPEAPVPVVDIDRKEYRLGGAANVALNVQRLGGEPVLCSVIGREQEAEAFQELITQEGISHQYLIQAEGRPTTVKTRVMGERHQLLRMDSETTAPLSEALQQQLLQLLERAIPEADAVLFVDYDKGILDQTTISQVTQWAQEAGIPTAVDPKKEHFFAYQGTTLFKPNLTELENSLSMKLPYPAVQAQLDTMDVALRTSLNHSITFVTLSEQGVYISNRHDSYQLPAHLRTIYDVSGAGDTVMSVATLALAVNCSIPVIAEMANLAGGLVCEEVGVVPIDRQKFFQECTRAMVHQQSTKLNVRELE